MVKAAIMILFLLFFSGASSGAGEITLDTLESDLCESPEILAAAASLAQSRALEDHQKFAGGLRYFGELYLGGINEPASRSDLSAIEGYTRVSVRGGIALPLFGTWRKERIRQLESRISALQEERRFIEVRKANLTALRKAYALLWASQEKKELLDRFLDLENIVMPLLARRTEEGFLLERDRLEMESWFSLVRREAASDALLKEECLSLIRKATGRSDLAGMTAVYPVLPVVFYSEDVLAAAAGEGNRELQILSRTAEVRREIARSAPKAQYDTVLRAGWGYSLESPGRNGTEGFLSLGVEVPAREGKAAAAAARAALAAAEKTEHEKTMLRLSIEQEILEGVSRFDLAVSRREFAQANVRSAVEAVRADRLRFDLLPGDVLEQFFRSMFLYLSSALSLIDNEGAMLQAHCELLGAIPENVPGEGIGKKIASMPGDKGEWSALLSPAWLTFSVSGDPAGKRPAQEDGRSELPRFSRAFYLWAGDSLLFPKKGAGFFEEAREEGADRVLISFSPSGIRMLKTEEGKARLMEALEFARKQGVKAELLLGDPSWILPEHRKELTDLVKEMEPFPFSGLHLDLEPDQLPGAAARRRELLLSLIETVREVKAVSQWALGLSIHPRYLEGELGSLSARGFGTAGVDELTVMIYSTNVPAVMKRMNAIIAAWPGLRFSLAVSVEKELPGTESFFRQGKKRFLKTVESMEVSFPASSSGDIVIQSWENYKEMPK